MQFDGADLEQTIVPPNSAPNAQPLPFRYNSQAFELPAMIELAIGYDYHLSTDNRLSVTTDFQNNNFGSDAYHFGAEYAFNEMFFLRGGYVYSPVEGSTLNSTIFGFSAGAGASVDLGGVRAQLDYAYGHTQYFTGVNTLSVLLAF